METRTIKVSRVGAYGPVDTAAPVCAADWRSWAAAAAIALAVTLLISSEVVAMIVPVSWALTAQLHLHIGSALGDALFLGVPAFIASAVVVFRKIYRGERRLMAGLDPRLWPLAVVAGRRDLA